MTKLHEILAVESSLEKAANKLIKESEHTFGKESLFNGQVRKLQMFRDEDKKSEAIEYQELTTTVDENINYLVKPISNWFDVTLKKDKTNQKTKADIIVDKNGVEITLAKDVPATFLLGLESKLTKLRTLYEKIPTLIPGIKWERDEQNREGVYRAEHNDIQMKTRKEPEYRVVYEATENHPAQIKEVNRTQDVGRYITTMYSGRMTPLEKAERLTKIDKLLQAVKQARMRANNIDVENANIGKEIFDYINN